MLFPGNCCYFGKFKWANSNPYEHSVNKLNKNSNYTIESKLHYRIPTTLSNPNYTIAENGITLSPKMQLHYRRIPITLSTTLTTKLSPILFFRWDIFLSNHTRLSTQQLKSILQILFRGLALFIIKPLCAYSFTKTFL